MNNKEDYIGKVLTWNQTVELFPNLWVAFKDCEFDRATFIKGTLVDVIEDKDRIEFIKKHLRDGLHIDRTTEENCSILI